jgi:hypothetical protein
MALTIGPYYVYSFDGSELARGSEWIEMMSRDAEWRTGIDYVQHMQSQKIYRWDEAVEDWQPDQVEAPEPVVIADELTVYCFAWELGDGWRYSPPFASENAARTWALQHSDLIGGNQRVVRAIGRMPEVASDSSVMMR